MKKTELKLPTEDEKSQRKALQAVAGVEGVMSIAVDKKEKTITVIGNADPLILAKKLGKVGATELLSVVPVEEEIKREEEKKEEAEEEKKADPPPIVYVNPSSNSYVTYQGYPYTFGRDDYNTNSYDYNTDSCTIC